MHDLFLDWLLNSGIDRQGVREWRLALTLTLSPKERESLRTFSESLGIPPGIAAAGSFAESTHDNLA
jgi:hypothetical protein